MKVHHLNYFQQFTQGRRSRSLDREPFDPEPERTFRQRRQQNKKPVNQALQITMGDALENNDPPKKLREYTAPATYDAPSCIVLTNIAQQFEIRPATIQLLPIFYGKENENPYNHLKGFFAICSTFNYQGVTKEQIRLRLFPFSLKDKALSWLDSLAQGSINSWAELSKKFLGKFFPARKTNALITAIMSFVQDADEPFHDAWERYKDLFLQCPHHGFEPWQKINYFYKGLTPQCRATVEV